MSASGLRVAHAAHAVHRHEAGFYSSDDEFRDLIVPFVEDAKAAGEPVVISYDARKSDLVRNWLGTASGITFVTNGTLYSNPARAIYSYRRLFERELAIGAERVRIAGDVPHAGNGGRFEGWDRYESAVNVVWQDLSWHGLCLYDATTVSPAVSDVVERTHPWLVTRDGCRKTNRRYEASFAGLAPAADPLEATSPLVALDGVAPGAARRAVEQVARGRIDDITVDELLIGVSEAATNARLHGEPPTALRVWATSDRVVVHIKDGGSGPSDPFVGLVPCSDLAAGNGLGLWLTHQLGIDVSLMTTPDGFTVRLRGGRQGEQVD